MIRIVKTENGTVKGIEAADPRITAFKGIPFAAPPVKENRWRAPQPCPDWEGTLEAYRFKPIGMQDTPGLGTDIYCREWHVDPDIEMSEDCLYLNVWTSAKSADEKQPVMVWYFGGGLQWGYPSEMEFDGERIARRGVVVVTVNYRLNAFGFLAHPELSASQPDAPTNFGHLDQKAGLDWVIRNIHAFGGDPNNITIAGQSAGGGSVLSLLTSPTCFGKFQKAIVQSAMINSPYKDVSIRHHIPLSEAERNGSNFFEYLGVKTLEEARALDAIYIRDMYSKYMQDRSRMMMTVRDDKFSVGNPLDLYMKNQHAQVPIMSGNTPVEFLNAIVAESDEEFVEKAKDLFGEHSEEFLEFEEAWKKDGNRYGAFSGIECTVKSLFLQNQRNNKDQKCYYYNFNPEIPGWDNPGSFHSVELWFTFETLAKCWRPFTGKHYDLARQMCNYWCNFVKNGDPNGKDADGTDMPYWSPYTKETPYGMNFLTDGPVLDKTEDSEFKKFMIERITEELLQ
ncbi:MAG: carboxylesterase family protein [Clostridiales bacterium]|nr:carboxylesterase family protein [Clostridiales bacterium]